MVSMSSFVPSMHIASQAPLAHTSSRQLPEKVGNNISSGGSSGLLQNAAAMTDRGQLQALESWRISSGAADLTTEMMQ